MKRPGSVSDDVLEHKGYHYRVLDLANAGCTIPQGWEFAPAEEELINALTSHFSVRMSQSRRECIVLGDCNAYGLRPAHKGLMIAKEAVEQHIRFVLVRDRPKPAAAGAQIVVRKQVSKHLAMDTPDNLITSQMWKKRRFTDFVIMCADREVPCHRAVLAEASPVFEAALTGNMCEASQGRFEIKDAEPDVVERMVYYMYNRTINMGAEDPAVLSAVFLTQLMSIGDRYGMRGLVQAAAGPVMDKLSPDNVTVVARTLRSIKEHPEGKLMWAELQERLRKEQALLEAVLADV